MSIWRMRIAFWIPEVTNTHSEYVILTAFPPQRWLHERAPTLSYTYVVCLVSLCHWATNYPYFQALRSFVKWRPTGVLISPKPDQEGNKLGSMSGTSAISTTWRRELSSSFFFPPHPARQGTKGNSRHSDKHQLVSFLVGVRTYQHPCTCPTQRPIPDLAYSKLVNSSPARTFALAQVNVTTPYLVNFVVYIPRTRKRLLLREISPSCLGRLALFYFRPIRNISTQLVGRLYRHWPLSRSCLQLRLFLVKREKILCFCNVIYSRHCSSLAHRGQSPLTFVMALGGNIQILSKTYV